MTALTTCSRPCQEETAMWRGMCSKNPMIFCGIFATPKCFFCFWFLECMVECFQCAKKIESRPHLVQPMSPLPSPRQGFFLMNWPVQGINHSHPRWPAGRGPSHWRILLMRLMVSRLWHFLMFGRFLFFFTQKKGYFDAKFKCSCPRVLFTVGTLDCVKCVKAFGRWIIRRARAPWRLTSFCMFLWRTNFFTKIWGMVVLKLVKKDRFLDSLFVCVCVKWVIWIYPRLMPSWQMKV